MKIEMTKQHKLLTVGQQLNIDAEYANALIKKGVAKSIEHEVAAEPKKTNKK